ncbi:hypothetical protein FRC10_005142 [Ceratobasidium sp. 414]|nr:hypothetical protein FRC10_005142 [Ceratobasidium sp. 414]
MVCLNAAIFMYAAQFNCLVVESLWRGDWIQVNNENNDIDYEEYKFKHDGSFWSHLDPSRLSVPRYQNAFRICLWLLFLFIYSRAIQQPLEQNRQPRHPLDGWEIALYVQALAYAMEEFHKLYKILRLFTWRAFNFWRVVSLLTDSLVITALVLRIWGLYIPDDNQSSALKLRSFQVLSCVSPLIWMKLITVVEGFKYVGTMQICVSRMLQESTIFFVLLSILGVGFAQGMYALDAADGVTELIVALLVLFFTTCELLDSCCAEESGFEMISPRWNVATTVILLNVLISLFSSAYEDITDDAEAQFLAFFAEKTISMIRVSLFETHLDVRRNVFMRQMFTAAQDGEEEDPENRDPQVENEDGMRISKKPFDEIVKAFPNSLLSSEATIMNELHNLRHRMEELFTQLEAKRATSDST